MFVSMSVDWLDHADKVVLYSVCNILIWDEEMYIMVDLDWIGIINIIFLFS